MIKENSNKIGNITQRVEQLSIYEKNDMLNTEKKISTQVKELESLLIFIEKNIVKTTKNNS